MNDEYAKTIVLGDRPLDNGYSPTQEAPVPEPVQPEAYDKPSSEPSPGYPAFEDTSWLT